MSEHTPLTEAERERVTWVLGDLLRYYAERRSMANPKGWDHVLRQFETAATDHYGLTEVQANEVRSVLTALAARTSTATADTGLRERVEELIRATELGIVGVSQLRRALDATPASTEDRADDEGTR